MSFFSKFPKTDYDLTGNGELTKIVDLFRHVGIDKRGKDDIASYKYYTIRDGERPDIVSQNLYKTPDLHWTFFLLNDFLKAGHSAWPKSYQEFMTSLTEQYSGISVITFVPRTTDLGGGSYQYENYFGSILNDPTNLFLLNNETLEARNIIGYDKDLLQIWVENSDAAFLSSSAGFALTYVNADDEEAHAWADEIGIPWLKEYHPNTHALMLSDSRLVEASEFDIGQLVLSSITPLFEVSTITDLGADPGYANGFEIGSTEDFLGQTIENLFINDYIDDVVQSEHSSYETAYNAPFEYYDSDGFPTSPLTLFLNGATTPEYKSIKEHEEMINNENSRIRVLRAEVVSSFSDEFERILNEQ